MKKMLFIQGGSRWKFDTGGNVYTDSNFNEAVWDRYRGYCGRLTVILRKEAKVYEPDEAKRRFNAFNKEKSDYIALPDLYRPARNCLNISYRRLVRRVIDEEVRKADLVVVRFTSGDVYANIAVNCAGRHNKPYLVEVTGFAFEQMWYHSLRGKLVAVTKEVRMRSFIKSAPYAVYVTEGALQKRYPCRGKFIGCSDVELPELDNHILELRLERIRESEKGRLVLGTAAFLNVKWKGQEYVIRALAALKEQGITEIEYRLVGGGDGEYLRQLSRRLGVEDEVRIMDALPHDRLFAWLDDIDVYIQPSFQEGLCRAIVEALSRACPVLASNVGGNSELIGDECLFRPGDSKQITEQIRRMMDPDVRLKQAKRNFERAHAFQKETLDEMRDAFYRGFVRESLTVVTE